MGGFSGWQTFRGRGHHSVITSPVRIDVGDCASGAGFRTFRIAAAKIAFDYLAGGLRVIHRSERTGDGTYFTADTLVIRYYLGTGCQIDAYRIDWAGVHAPGFITLSAGIGCEPTLVMKCEYLDIGSGWVECTRVIVRACHLAL